MKKLIFPPLLRSAVHKNLHCYLNNLHFSNVLYYQVGCFGAEFVGGVPRESWFNGQVTPACPVSEWGFWFLGGDFLLRLLHTHAVRGVRQHLFWDLLPASVPNIGPTCDQLADEFDFGLFDPQFFIWVYVNRQ